MNFTNGKDSSLQILVGFVHLMSLFKATFQSNCLLFFSVSSLFSLYHSAWHFRSATEKCVLKFYHHFYTKAKTRVFLWKKALLWATQNKRAFTNSTAFKGRTWSQFAGTHGFFGALTSFFLIYFESIFFPNKRTNKQINK